MGNVTGDDTQASGLPGQVAAPHGGPQLSSSTLAGKESGQGKSQVVEKAGLHPSCSFLHG